MKSLGTGTDFLDYDLAIGKRNRSGRMIQT
jgi:hypothetical protein